MATKVSGFCTNSTRNTAGSSGICIKTGHSENGYKEAAEDSECKDRCAKHYLSEDMLGNEVVINGSPF